MHGMLFDVWTEELLFHLDAEGFGDLDFGAAVRPSIDGLELANRLEIQGNYVGGGPSIVVDFACLCAVPESTLSTPIVLVAWLIVRNRRKKR